MKEIDSRIQLIFGIKVALSAIFSFYLCSALNLPQAQWAVLTACMILNPLSGFGRSRGLYRVLGTVLGAIFGIVVYALFHDSPLVVLGVSSAFLLAGAYISYIYNSPRNYVFLIAGITTLMVNLSASAGGPQVLFDTFVWRILEIAIGVAVALCVDSIIVSPSTTDIFVQKVDAWLLTIDQWISDIFKDSITQTKDLHQTLAEIEVLDQIVFHSRFESSITPEHIRIMGILRKRMLVLIPAITSLKNQIAELRKTPEAITDSMKTILLEAEQSLGLKGVPAKQAIRSLIKNLDEFIESNSSLRDWGSIVEFNLAVQLKHIASHAGDIRLLRSALKVDQYRKQIILRQFQAEKLPKEKHVDKKIAILSVLPGVLATFALLSFWGLTGNSQLTGAFMMGSIMAVFLGSADDPAKGIQKIMFVTLAMMALAGIYMYLIYPNIQTFWELAFVLFFPLFFFGRIMAKNQGGLIILAMFITNIGFQTSYTPISFDLYIEGAIGSLIGYAVAMVSNQLIRSVSTEWMIERLVLLSRVDIGAFAHHGNRTDKYNFINVMLNRLNLIVLRLQLITDEKLKSVDLMPDLQAGYHLAYLRDHVGEAAAPVRSQIHQLVVGAAGDIQSSSGLSEIQFLDKRMVEIDDSIRVIIENGHLDAKNQDIMTHLLGLRLQFFSDASPLKLHGQSIERAFV